ncbi:hypothetical protein CsSME_00053288 [Camellia sinensis var. sinensis]|uniref:Uncharacterized protein n=1 Tax=Camellia sinensis var. sinensis TaxID=542762 RepID=A0A4S4D815_CAMSN|nr:uncharacterized protein LOC114315549 [Camellia sinensis]THF97545.1 hypothetical protein TEA_003024 [Camellia sinensis var. sinensis]
MGNCQAIDNATLAIQHPCGRVDKLYWPVNASEVMKMNPGHYVALLLTTTTTTTTGSHNSSNSVRITRIKLLRPTDTLILGQVYRLITTEEVMKGLWAKKYAKMKKRQSESPDKQERMKEKMGSDSEMKNTNQVQTHERHRPRTTTTGNSAAAKSRAWQPSLHSISEATI